MFVSEVIVMKCILGMVKIHELTIWLLFLNSLWDCGQNPRLFLKEEKGFGKVHKGRVREGNRSLHQVLQAGHHGLKELGYPNWRHTLDSLYGGYEEKDEENESDADKRMKSLSERTTIPEASLIRSI